MRTLAIVPARKGSKGIPGKNTRMFCGKPLVSWAIGVVQRTCGRVVLTTDDPDVFDIAGECDVDRLKRPPELAQDDTPMLDVLVHALACQAQPVDVVVLLQPTSPLRKDEHIRQALWMLKLQTGLDSVVSVVEIPAHQNPEYACKINDEGMLKPYLFSWEKTRRQNCTPAYYRDGTVYAIRAPLIRRHEMYGRAMPLLIPAGESCTIDTEDDWTRAEELWRRANGGAAA